MTPEPKGIPIQERRIGAIGAYWGPVQPLIEAITKKQAAQRIRTFCQTKWDEITSALQLLHQITDAAVVVHGAKGCSSVKHFLNAFYGSGGSLISSNLNENDSIMGSDIKLSEAIRRAHRYYNPNIIFVVTTPIVAINSDDVQSVTVKLSNELGIPVVPVFADGFKSKIGANGYDIALHALASYLIPPARRTNHKQVNIVSTTEHLVDIEYLFNLVSSIGLEPNIFPQFGNLNNLKKSAEALVSIGLRSESRIIGEYLESEQGVHFVQPIPPIGIKATSSWLTFIGDLYGHQSEASLLVRLKTTECCAEIERLSSKLSGLKVYISGAAVIALSLANLVEEFGARVIGLSLFDLDQNTAKLVEENYNNNKWNFNLHVGEGQIFEQVNIVSRIKPDIYLGGLGQAAPIARLGIPAVCYSSMSLYGYIAATKLVKKLILATQNKSLVNRLAFYGSPYTDSWLQKSPNWYIKQEVR